MVKSITVTSNESYFFLTFTALTVEEFGLLGVSTVKTLTSMASWSVPADWVDRYTIMATNWGCQNLSPFLYSKNT